MKLQLLSWSRSGLDTMLLWAAFVMLAPTVCAEELRVVNEKTFITRGIAEINSLSTTKSGEVILCGQDTGAWFVAMSPDGEIKRNTLVEKEAQGVVESCWTVLRHSDVGAVIAGQTNSGEHHQSMADLSQPPSYRFLSVPTGGLLAFLSRAGATTSKVVFGTFRPYYQNAFYRGVALDDGYVLLGMNQREWPSENARGIGALGTVWLLKVDLKGKLVWEYELSEDDGDILEIRNGDYLSDVVLLPDGSIVFGAAVLRPPFAVRDGKRYLFRPGFGSYRRSTRNLLVLRVSPDGKELARRALSGGSGLLFSEGGRLTIIHQVTNVAQKSATTLMAVVTLDRDLNVTGSKVSDLGSQRFRLYGAISAGEADLYVLGQYTGPDGPLPLAREMVLGQIQTNGKFRILQRYGRANSSGHIALEEGSRDFVVARTVLFRESADLWRTRVVLTKYRVPKGASTQKRSLD